MSGSREGGGGERGGEGKLGGGRRCQSVAVADASYLTYATRLFSSHRGQIRTNIL